MSFYAAPNQQRHLRACMVCSIVQSHTKFQRDGCPNCETSLQLRGNSDAIQECTSQVFEGLIAVRDPTVSWVARWQRLDNYVPGTYATKVTGTLPDYIIGSLEDSGVKYVPRDGTTGEEDT
ncbi:uncharacterized protein N7484_001366 [Penicillium longicatenatum]|uniref:Transcription elongation factor SPT4 n=1 Tax=Penicillium frequentans TaxID=3151616 RepID=A0AAD6GJG1_9EURO|nr:uncharacterized protein N7503_003421 [Penicillium pulvis]XP_056976523.1 uncharacterized protein N7484_001366 [Penicillium longicatenatum]KAJ5523491.1 hypothetical protein N7513_013035 [Penicillium glabrum]KAJ5903409.1 hypothetical protein N7504_005792 [Penicillium tannophilum]KAJ5552568.1 hypothetical protein N7494_001946 [Penicillium glabrum]KAJ5657717.1 hypothetical protein N7484_001366 [Penicillium longicatenatum]KAJ5663396.1 hypothetical protein N7507_004127 [Penicillium longicatenatum